MTVWEMLQDPDFVEFNQTDLPNLIQTTTQTAGVENPVGLPGLFYNIGTDQNPKGIAYTPNPANLQWVNSNPVHANPFGPRNSSGTDVLRESIQALTGATSVFLDDWLTYHLNSGEVHCGSNAERQPEASWWTK